jgi:hypothetical protein
VLEADQKREASTADLLGGLVRAAILLAMEFILISLFVPRPWADHVQAAELAGLQEHLGPTTSAEILLTAEDWYRALLVDPGVVGMSYNLVTLSPDDIAQARASGLGPLTQFALWDWMAGRLDVLWWMIRHAFQRLVLLLAWWPFLLLVAVFAAADGWLRRRIRQSGFTYASPLKHHYAVRGLFWLGILGLFGLFLPVPWSPWLIPVLGALLAALVAVLVANTQKRV